MFDYKRLRRQLNRHRKQLCDDINTLIANSDGGIDTPKAQENYHRFLGQVTRYELLVDRMAKREQRETGGAE